MDDSRTSIQGRKRDHIEVAASGRADFRERTTLLEQVHLAHQSMPELSLDQVDLTTSLCGHELAAPVVLSGMTGGTEEARQINCDLAIAAGERGIAFGVGSQRAMAEHPELASTYQVRDVAPEVFLIGNIGVVQARQLGAQRIRDLVEEIDANALAVHLNPGQELIQEGGDRDFRGCRDTLAALVESLHVPIIAKETGCGLSAQAAKALYDSGVRTVNVSGAGGTSWVAVEAQRAAIDSPSQRLGLELWDWGIPTAVSANLCAAQGLEVIATGGLRGGLDIARALALGARAGGIAASALRAQRSGGVQGVRNFLDDVIRSLTSVTLLTGCPSTGALATAPRHLGGELRSWLNDLGGNA